MTIRDFALLCGCSTQTLRYYDRVDLLKPMRVDAWSGYRFYEEEQALTFVRIKNLQRAGFTIAEIKELLGKDDPTVAAAFDAKIARQERRLAEMKEIRRSYQTEMEKITEKIKEVREKVMQAMLQYDPTEEFGVSAAQYAAILGNVKQYFDELDEHPPKDAGYRAYSDDDAPQGEMEYLASLQSAGYALVCEKHGWAHVKEFFDEIDTGEEGAEYALVFRVDPTKGVYNEAFGNTVLGILLEKNAGKSQNLSCTVEESTDGGNHFWFLKRK